MKKRIIFLISIFTLILVLIISRVIADQKINSNNNIVDKDDKITYTKPTDPYGWEYLNDWQKELYKEIGKDTFKIGDDYYLDQSRKEEDIQLVVDLYVQNNPTILPIVYTVVDNKIHKAQWLTSNMNEALNQLSEIEKKADEIISLIPPLSSDYEKVKIIYDYLIQNIEIADDELEKAELGLPFNLNIWSEYGALIENKAVCDGIAKAFYYVAKKADIYVLYVTSNELNHAWNIVWLDGKYYLVDATWRIFLTYANYQGDFVKSIPLPDTKHAYIEP